MKEKFFITTAITYTSKLPHIGNIYEIILTDSIARYKKKRGYDVFFLTGTDEHGQKIQAEAEARGVSPQEYVDEIAGGIRKLWDLYECEYDRFIRTTDERHMETVKKIYTRLYEQVTDDDTGDKMLGAKHMRVARMAMPSLERE